MRRTILAVLFAFALPVSALAATDPDHPTVNATTVFMHGQDPAKTGHCTAAVFAQFTDKKGFVAQNWTTTLHLTNGSTRPESDALTPPAYGDTYTFGGIVWKAPAGTHWAYLSQTYRDGSAPNDCTDFDTKNHALYPDPVVITYGRTDACQSAIDNVAGAKVNIKAAKKRLRGAHGNAAKKAAAKQLKRFKAYLKRSQKAYAKAC